MKNYTVKATRSFTDATENVYRNENDIFNCTKERYEFLKENNAVELVEVVGEKKKEIIEEKKEEEVKPVEFQNIGDKKPRKTTKKKNK